LLITRRCGFGRSMCTPTTPVATLHSVRPSRNGSGANELRYRSVSKLLFVSDSHCSDQGKRDNQDYQKMEQRPHCCVHCQARPIQDAREAAAGDVRLILYIATTVLLDSPLHYGSDRCSSPLLQLPCGGSQTGDDW
jgi:hypothetical protein